MTRSGYISCTSPTPIPCLLRSWIPYHSCSPGCSYMASPLILDVYYSFRSPYSYLATPRLASWPDKYNIQIRLRPVLPLVVRTPEFFEKANPLLFNYIQKLDTYRVAEYLGIPFQWANPDPVVVHR